MHLSIKVIPNASETMLAGIMSDDTIKIRLKAIPEKGKANEELIRFLAETLHLQKHHVEIVSGFTQARKLVKIPDLTPLPW